MESTQKTLMRVFWSAVILSMAMVVVFETDLLLPGVWAEEKSSEFFVAVVMELLTICAIPLALRLFKFKHVAAQIHHLQGFRKWALLRLLMLCVPMMVNTLLYYLYMNVAFGYMGIILLLSLCFIVPTKSRCRLELSQARGEEKD